ncbi:Gfo/Idh/MocA family oxidoreductase [Streptomyces sp. NPDC004232]|uniref:Gfo/Idh/MocA family protein n=1 Tax=Streptomyces sp. NPDC004232 TaxID=3154454 RepID=UPI0033A492E3
MTDDAEHPPLRFGVLGCADIAVRRTIPAILAAPTARLVALASRTPGKAEHYAAHFGRTVACGYHELLRRDDIDAVYVPLPTGLHAEWIESALVAGKHVLAEKPLTTRHPDTLALTAIANRLGLTLQENLTAARHRLHTAVSELVAAGEIGELRGMEACFGIPSLPATDVRYASDLGGGALLDVGVYPLYAATRFLGAGLSVAGATQKTDPARGVDVAGHALLYSASGVAAQVTFGFEHAYRCSYRLWGSEGVLSVDRAYTPPPAFNPLIRLVHADREREVVVPAEDQFMTTISEFVAATRGSQTQRYDETDFLEQARLVDHVRDRALALADKGRT